MNPLGPALIYDEAKAEVIIATLNDGAPLETAAAAAGIDRKTLHNWLRWGARGIKPELADFSRRVRATVCDWERRQLRNIESAAATSWQASAWLLERRYPLKYGRRSDEAIIEFKVEAKLKQLLKRARQKPALKAVG